MKKKIYLALPYSHPDPFIQEQRFKAANIMAGILMEEGNHVYSPISHSHPISLHIDLDYDRWLENSLAFLESCDEMIVYCLPGWKESKGVQAEIAFAQTHSIPIVYYVDKVFKEKS